MIEVKIGLDGVPSPNKVVLGNRWENNDEKIHFDLPQSFDSYNKYVVGVIKQSTGNQTVVLPVKDNIMYVSSELTWLNGNWNLYLMCRETALDLENETIDIRNKTDEHVFISDGFIGVVNKNMIEQDAVENIALDTNLQIVYDELLALKKNILDEINGNKNEALTGSYKDLTEKPSINGKELTGDQTLYDFGYIPIHKVEVKSFPALYKAIKAIGLSLDEEDVSNFLFLLHSNEVETTFNNEFVELEIMNIYTAEYSPITNVAIIKGSKFVMTINKEGVLDYKALNQDSTSIDAALLDAKLDIDQGAENANKVLAVGEDGKVIPVESSTLGTVDSEELDTMLEEVFANG